jgi:2-oxo-3-hexenedioate decarboxylase
MEGSAEGYAAALRYRQQRLREGWRAAGRKIGFTNRSIWPRYGVHQPIWGTVFDRTLLFAKQDICTVRLENLAQPRIEPEICFKLKAVPRNADAQALLACLDWMAHSIEIVQCDQPGWKTSLAHSTAANGLHGLLIVGTPVAVAEAHALPGVQLVLRRGATVVDRGSGKNVLGSPLVALGHLVELLRSQPDAPPLAAGEIVTTGTLTDAHPVAPGETWHTEIAGISIPGLTVQFT